MFANGLKCLYRFKFKQASKLKALSLGFRNESVPTSLCFFNHHLIANDKAKWHEIIEANIVFFNTFRRF